MLSTYATLESMHGARDPRTSGGTDRRDLQMDRRHRRGPLFGSTGSGRAKNIDRCESGYRDIRARGGDERRADVRRADGGTARGPGVRLHPICHRLAGTRAELFRRRSRHRQSGAQPGSQIESCDHLAAQRQTHRRSGPGDDTVQSAAIGPRHVCHRGDHHRSTKRRIPEHGQRHLFRATAFGFVAAAPKALARFGGRPDGQIGR